MLTTSEVWRALLADRETETEYRCIIAGTAYGSARIFSCRVDRALFTGAPAIGMCCAATLTLSVIPDGVIPRMAEITASVRLRNGERASEWLPLGTFWIDTREQEGERLTLTCYDAMLKTEALFFTEGEWEDIPMQAAAEEIAARIGVTLDPRTALNPAYIMGYPNDYTMREVLGYIGAAHGGNWIITPENRLRLVPLRSIPDETYYIIDEAGNVVWTDDGFRLVHKT